MNNQQPPQNKSQNTILQVLALFSFVLGLAISLIFNGLVLWSHLEGMAFWGYPESIAFDSSLTTEARISNLRCPIVLTPGETDWAELTISNPNEYPIRTWISAHISQPGRVENMLRRTRSRSLDPGAETELVWQLTEENVIYDRMILVRVFLRLTEHHPPSRTRHCGILFVDLFGLTGTQFLLAAVLGSIILKADGLFLWWHFRRSRQKSRQDLVLRLLLGLFILSLVTTLGSIFRQWLLGLIGLALIPLLIFSVLGYYFGKLDRQVN